MPYEKNVPNPSEKSPALPETTSRVQAMKRHLLKHRPVFATLAKETYIKMGFTTDPNVTGYFAPETREVQVGLGWIVEAGLDDTQALFVPVHEFGHVKDFEEDPEEFLGSFERHTQLAKDFVRSLLQEHYSEQTVPEPFRQQLESQVVSRVLGAVNALDDLAVNTWALQQVPKLRREQAVSRLYREVLYAAPKEVDAAQSTSRAEELLKYLVRGMMITDAPDDVEYSPAVVQAATEPVHHWRVLGSKPVSLEQVVTVLSSYIRSHKRFFRFAERMQTLEKIVLPVYLDLLKQDITPQLPTPEKLAEFLQPQSNETQRSAPEASGQTKSRPPLVPGQGAPSVPSSLKPTTEAEVERMRESLSAVADEIKARQEYEKLTPEEKQKFRRTEQFLKRHPEVRRADYLEYERTREEVAGAASELAKLWQELLGRQQELVKTGSHLSPGGGRLDSRAMIRNYPKIRQGVSDVSIFEKTERGPDTGSERPKEVRFRIVLDRSGSMTEDPASLRLLQQLYVTLFDSFDRYKAEALARGAMQQQAFLDIRSECLGYGSLKTEAGQVVHEMKPLTPPRASRTEKAEIVKAYSQVAQSLIGNSDEQAVLEIDERVRAAQAKDSENVLDIVFYLTDGAPDNEEALRENLQGIATDNTLWRAFQLESNYAGFDAVWNESATTRGVPVTLEDIIPKMIEAVREILGSL